MRRISSSRQLSTTLHPVNEISSTLANSGLDSKNSVDSLLSRRRVWICDSEALITDASEHIARMIVGALANLDRRSYRALLVATLLAIRLIL